MSNYRSVLYRNIPGISHFYHGHFILGSILFGFFCGLLLVVIFKSEKFLYGLISFFVSIKLLILDTDHWILVFRADMIEHWIASLFILFAITVLWISTRKQYKKYLSVRDEHELSQWGMAWREFKKNKSASFGLTLIGFLYCMVFLCPLLAPYDPNVFIDGATTQFRSPFSRVKVLYLLDDRVSPQPISSAYLQSPYSDELLFLYKINTDLTDHGLTKVMYVDAFHIEGADVYATVGLEHISIPISQLAGSEPEQFSGDHLFLLGTDSYGRDILSRIIYGSRVSLSLGFIAVLLSITLGTVVGLFAGYFGRFVDSSLMRFVDILLAFPSLFLILIIIAVFEEIQIPRVILVVSVLGLTSWMGIARLVRGEVLSLKEREFVMAARAIGLGHMKILFRHILPNSFTPIIVNATLRIGGIILIEAALSFLNLGVQQPTASWGNIIFEGKDFLYRAWWISTLPGFAIVATVVSFNLVGDGLRDAFDPLLKDTSS